MKISAGARIPAFTDCESKQVKGSFDFIGLIYYVTANVSDNQDSLKQKFRDITRDMAADMIRKFFGYLMAVAVAKHSYMSLVH